MKDSPEKSKSISPSPDADPPIRRSVDDTGSQALSEALRTTFVIIKVLMVGLVVAFFASGIFTVENNEVATVLRFGRQTSTELLGPGLHWAFPYPIDEKVKIAVSQSHSVTATNGWYAITPELEALGEIPPPRASMMPGYDGYTLTNDGNIIHVKATLKYRISNAMDYRFRFADIEPLLKNIVDNALFYASSQFSADDILYQEKDRFQFRLNLKINQSINDYDLGITLEPLDIQTSAPLDVQESFDAVITAESEANRLSQEAEGYRSTQVALADGDYQKIINAGLTESNRVVNAVAADAQYFKDQLPHYQRNPELFKRRLLVEAMGRIFSKASHKFFLPESSNRDLRILLNRGFKEPKKRTDPQMSTTP
jgi:membrane protease subunit HflK